MISNTKNILGAIFTLAISNNTRVKGLFHINYRKINKYLGLIRVCNISKDERK